MFTTQFAAYYGKGSGLPLLLLLFFIIRPKRRTKLDRFIFWLGNASIIYIIFMVIWSQLHRAKNWDDYIAWGIMAYVIAVIMAAIRYLGESSHISSFKSQTLHLFKNLFLWLFLPAGLITALLLLLSYIFHWSQ
jgi:chromate transport protein ChrA